jgi:hypothetical protein
MIPSFNLWWFMMRHRTWRHYVMISLSNKLSQNVNLRWFLLLICDGLWCGIGPEDIMWQFIFSQSSICGVDDAIIIKMLPSLVHSGVHWWCMTKFYISSESLNRHLSLNWCPGAHIFYWPMAIFWTNRYKMKLSWRWSQFVMIFSFNMWLFMMRHRTWRHYVTISHFTKFNLWR